MTVKKLLLMLSACVVVMAVLLGGYSMVWNFAQDVENEALFDDTDVLGVISGDVVEGSGPLAIGDEGERVYELQRVLAELGYYEGEADGVYGMMTGEAVRRYQSELGITENGTAGIATLFALGLAGGEAVESDEAAVLAAAIELHAGDEPFGARVAVGAVILERARLLGSLSRGIAYYGTEELRRRAVDSRSYAAARAAMEGIMPVGDALFFSREKPEGDFSKLGRLYFYR
ncbi:MAG: peptidoglycan-binding protein [Clostridia bacterium]|nr:peptidoglycan-binding protein [Clostridia bacterium]